MSNHLFTISPEHVSVRTPTYEEKEKLSDVELKRRRKLIMERRAVIQSIGGNLHDYDVGLRVYGRSIAWGEPLSVESRSQRDERIKNYKFQMLKFDSKEKNQEWADKFGKNITHYLELLEKKKKLLGELLYIFEEECLLAGVKIDQKQRKMNNCETCGVKLEEGQIGLCDECQENDVNTNCLEGMRCPKCKSIEPFKIEVKTTALVYDNGVEETQDNEWEDDSHCECYECHHSATVKEFTIKNQRSVKCKRRQRRSS